MLSCSASECREAALSADQRGDEGRPDVRAVERMEPEVLGEHFEARYAAHRIALGIQARCVTGNAKLAIDDSDDAATHTALGRDADVIGPMPRIIIHAAGEHDGKRAANRGEIESMYARPG